MKQKIILKPKTLFLIDGLGALLTAFILMAVLKPYHEYIGMPRPVLTWLSLIAVCFCLYSITCSFLVKTNERLFIGIIITANLLYCLLTTGLVLYHYSNLTVLGVTYFLAEIIVIVVLVFFELNTWRALKKTG
jgi:hypothetical protein